MRKLLSLILMIMFLVPVCAEESILTMNVPTRAVRPGRAVELSFTVPEAGHVTLTLRSSEGESLMTVVEDLPVEPGLNRMVWNGTSMGVFAPEGVYDLVLTMGELSASAPVVVGPAAPYLTGILADSNPETGLFTVDFYASEAGLLTTGLLASSWTLVENRDIEAGPNRVTVSSSLFQPDTVALTLTLTDSTGYSSNEEHVVLDPAVFGVLSTLAPTATASPSPTPSPSSSPEPTATPTASPSPTPSPEPTPEPTPDIVFTPSYGSTAVVENEAPNYWNTPMDITDEDAIWAMLTSPFTYIDRGVKNGFKGQTKIYAEPDKNSRTVGLVTGNSQGVRVLEVRDDGWTKIETYSSTFHDNSIQAWNMLIQGYVPSSMVKTKVLDDKFHIIVDKLTQRAYLFEDGKLKTTLLVSTGLSNAEQPFNETRSGDFRFISATGNFKSVRLMCNYGMKFNDGDLLHEVPHIVYSNGNKDYSSTEPKLGQRASHGCIRVQRKKTPEGINMYWIWSNRKDLGRIVVWEDWQGRQIPIPSDDTLLYYNPKGGTYYHRADHCESAKSSVVFESFTYADLDTGEYAELEFCPYCAPALRRAEIEEINKEHAFGADYDPILTKARQKYLESVGYENLTESEKRYWVEEE